MARLVRAALPALLACGAPGQSGPQATDFSGFDSPDLGAAGPASGAESSESSPSGDAPGAPGSGAGTADGESAGPDALTVDEFSGVADYDRGPGMPIGAEGDAEGEDQGESPLEPLPAGESNQDLEIPVFELEEDTAPPCSGCIELSVLLDSPDQSAAFSFDAGGVDVTRVVWNLILPKNEDQLFIRTRVNGGDGPYRQTLANAFPVVGAPFEYLHEQGEGNVWSGTANDVGLVIGSSGGWARNERMRVFVESVVLEGANGATRSFDAGAEGVVPTTTAQDPRVTFHP